VRVAFTVPWGYRLGGAENMLWAFLRRVDGEELEPVVIFLQGGPFEREAAALGIETAVIPAGRLRQLHRARRAVATLTGLLRRVKPDLIVNWTPKTQVYGSPAAAIAGMSRRVVWWQHGIPSGHWLDRAATALPAVAVGCSSRASAAAQARLRPHRRTFVVHPGIEPPLAIAPEETARLRSKLGIADGTPVVGIVGRLQPWKGQHRVLAAIADLRRRGHDVHCLIIGGDAYGLSPEYARSLRTLADEPALRKAVTLTGQVESPAPYMSLIDVLVSASDEEPFGIVLVEAMALGVPVIAVALGGPVEIIESEESGLLVPTGAPAEIAQALERLLVDEVFRRNLGEGGRRRYRKQFTATHMAEGVVRHLEAVLE
jgi:glycosyltransferase involved in cell wall biosynthesis